MQRRLGAHRILGVDVSALLDEAKGHSRKVVEGRDVKRSPPLSVRRGPFLAHRMAVAGVVCGRCLQGQSGASVREGVCMARRGTWQRRGVET